jgi:hypothetical protein
MKLRTEFVRFMPVELRPSVLYVSIEFGIATHLCPCGCGAKVRTPLGPTEWELNDTEKGSSLLPSIGNWQRCGSHYFIRDGQVIWLDKWTPSQIEAGRRAEQQRDRKYFEQFNRERAPLRRAWRWLQSQTERLVGALRRKPD